MEITQNVKSAVSAYLLARTYAEIMREKVDSIQSRILSETTYNVSPEFARRGRKIERIIEPKNTWLMSTADLHDFLCDVRHECNRAGLETPQATDTTEFWSYYCPALVAESLQKDAEHLLIESMAEMIGEASPKDFLHRLLCAGLAKYHHFIDLTVKMTLAHPDYTPPTI